jgi:MerR family transcriptional regulator/heat shock protein HspR
MNEPILSISVAAKLLNLHPRTVMLYERIGLISPHRTSTQRRLFSVKDLDELQFVKFLTKEKGVNLQGVKFIQEAISLTGKVGVDLRKMLFPQFKPVRLF